MKSKLRTVDLPSVNAHELVTKAGDLSRASVAVIGLVALRTVPGDPPGVVFHFTANGDRVAQSARLYAVPQPYGGARWLWTCPVCGKRVMTLYVAHVVACRHCHDLAYESTQSRRDWMRTCDNQIAKLRGRLRCSDGAAWDSIPPRPRYMRHRTYAALASELRDLLEVRRWALRVAVVRILASGPSEYAAQPLGIDDDEIEDWLAGMYKDVRAKWGRG